MSRTFSITDQAQEDNTKRLTNRTCDINICKNTLERAISAQVDEITLLEDQRNRLKRSLAVLGMPERIGILFDASKALVHRTYFLLRL